MPKLLKLVSLVVIDPQTEVNPRWGDELRLVIVLDGRPVKRVAMDLPVDQGQPRYVFSASDNLTDQEMAGGEEPLSTGALQM